MGAHQNDDDALRCELGRRSHIVDGDEFESAALLFGQWEYQLIGSQFDQNQSDQSKS